MPRPTILPLATTAVRQVFSASQMARQWLDDRAGADAALPDLQKLVVRIARRGHYSLSSQVQPPPRPRHGDIVRVGADAEFRVCLMIDGEAALLRHDPASILPAPHTPEELLIMVRFSPVTYAEAVRLDQVRHSQQLVRPPAMEPIDAGLMAMCLMEEAGGRLRVTDLGEAFLRAAAALQNPRDAIEPPGWTPDTMPPPVYNEERPSSGP